MKSAFITILVMALLGVISVLMIMYSGIFNVAATENHSKLTQWILFATRESSIEKRAMDIEVPDLNDENKIKDGFRSYREMCAVCHTPPGGEDSPIAQGLNPQAPNLACEANELSNAELFWVIKNGIRMTGMPAWGMTHGDKEIWDVVALVKALPKMTAAQYRELDRSTEAGHSHGAGGHDRGEMEEHEAGTDGHDMSKRDDHHDLDEADEKQTAAKHDLNKADDHNIGGHTHGKHAH